MTDLVEDGLKGVIAKSALSSIPARVYVDIDVVDISPKAGC